MGTVRQDRVQLRLEIDASPARTELDNTTRRQQVLIDSLKTMKKGTAEYVAASAELRQVTARIGELQKELGVTSLTYGQLIKLQGDLKRSIAQLVPGTEEFVAASAKLIEVENRLGQVKQAIHGVEQANEQAGGSFGKIGSIVKGAFAFAGVQLGIDLLRNFASSSVDEFAKSESAAAQLEATITSTGEAAGITVQRAKELSAALEKKTTFDGDDVTKAQSLLLTFTEIKGAVYEQALPAITDLATKMAGDGPADLKGATIQIGKALNDPIKGIAALGDAGVSFTEKQKETIKTLVATNQMAEAQTIILKELEKEFGGSAEAAAKAGLGPIKQFQVQIGNAKEAVGEFIVKGLEQIAPALQAILTGFVTFIGILRAIPAFVVEYRGALGGLAVALITLNATQLIAYGRTLALAAAERARTIATAASAAAQRLLNGAMNANPIGLLIAAVALLVGGFITLYERSEKVRATVAGLGAAFSVVFKNIRDVAVNYLAGIGNLIAGILTGDIDQIKQGGKQLLSSVEKMYSGIGDGVADAYNSAYDKRMAEEHAAQLAKEDKRSAERKKKAEENAKTEIEGAALEALKAREAALKVQLANAKEDSLAELRLKQQLRAVERDIALQDAKKTEGDRKVIRAEALADIRKLEVDFNKERRKEALAAAKEREEIERSIYDREIALIPDETTRKIAQLSIAASREREAVKGTEEQKTSQIVLINAKLQQDIAEVKKTADEKAAKAAEKAAQELVDIEQRKSKALAEAAVSRAERGGSPYAVLAAKLSLLDAEKIAETSNAKLTAEEKFKIEEDYEAQKDELRKKYLDDQQKAEVEAATNTINAISAGLSLLSDIQKSSSDIAIAREEKAKTQRLKLLDQEYKSGKISKDRYEKEKADITTGYDDKVRGLKNKQAQQEKQWAIAQTIMQGVLAVLAASARSGPFSPQTVAAGILSAISLAKVIATPIPTYAAGGVVGAAWRGVKKFANGGRLNSRAGVADVGQLHSDGGIQMIDGATGQHLGEWERGEPYMILSRQTYANNRQIIDELLDTSLYRGGAPIRRGNGRFASGGVQGDMPRAAATAGSDDLLRQIVANTASAAASATATVQAVAAIPSRLHAVVDRDGAYAIGDAVQERDAIRDESSF